MPVSGLVRILGFVAILWGFRILYNNFYVHPTVLEQLQASGLTNSTAGQLVFGVFIGGSLLIFGLRFMFRGYQRPERPPQKKKSKSK